MNNVKKSFMALAAVSALGVSVQAESFKEALKGGKTSGEIRATYVTSDTIDTTSYNVARPNDNLNTAALGLRLNYETGSYKGLVGQVGFQTNHNFHLEDDAKQDPRSSADGTNMYLANVSYGMGDTVVKVGRQTILTPLVGGSNTFNLRDSFDALSIESKAVENTEIKFYAIKAWIERYNAASTGDNSRVTSFQDPTYSLYVKNKTTDSLTLQGQYFTVTDSDGVTGDAPVKIMADEYSTYYAMADYKLATSTPLSIGAYHAGATYDTAGEKDTTMNGIKLGGKIAGTAFKLAYTVVADDNDFAGTFGHIPAFFKYNGGQMWTDHIYAGTTSTSLMVIPKLIPGVFSLFAYSTYSQSDAGIANSSVATSSSNMDGASELQADLRYKFADGLSTRLTIAALEYDTPNATDSSVTKTSLYLNYAF